jgi:HPt (histidine-containing phosphotransfer) domain-containing protein
MPELQQRYIGHRERDVATIIAAMKRDDFELIATLGHNMRGTAASYGYPEVGAIGEQIEAAATQRNLVLLADQLESLDAWIGRARAGQASGPESFLDVPTTAHKGGPARAR